MPRHTDNVSWVKSEPYTLMENPFLFRCLVFVNLHMLLFEMKITRMMYGNRRVSERLTGDEQALEEIPPSQDI